MFHFAKGRGEDYCAGCRATAAPCATTEPGQCTYNVHAPRTDAGRMAWGVFKDTFWRVRTAGLGGVIGVDLDRAIARLERAGIETDLAEDLLTACERGFVAAMSEKDDDPEP